mmetsp:Transcript_51121/g.119729  ORF Transcript_51121/g.119729 Transcript_51121/m.119729 type:complete len:203 (+) Transcript_51121:4288-4896(+)
MRIFRMASLPERLHAKCRGVLPSSPAAFTNSRSSSGVISCCPACARRARRRSGLFLSTASINVCLLKCFSWPKFCRSTSPVSSKPLAIAKSSAVTPPHAALTLHSLLVQRNFTNSTSPRSTATCKAVPRWPMSSKASAAKCMVSISRLCHAAPEKVSLLCCAFLTKASLACSYENELQCCLLHSRIWQSKQPQTTVWPWFCI